jgi:uncharacterized protein (TIRG00374 family)
LAASAAGRGAKYFGIALGIALLWVYFEYFFDYRTASTHFAQADWVYLGLSLASFLAAIAVRCVKWTYIVRTSKSMTWSAGFHVMLAANMVNFLFPVRMGEVARLYLAKSVSAVPYATSVSATLIDRFSSLLVLMLAFGLYPATGFAGIDPAKFGWVFGLVAAASIVFLLLGELIGKALPSAARWLLSGLGFRSERIERLVSSRFFLFAASTLVNCHLPRYGWRVTGVVFALSFLFLLGDALTFLLLLNAFSLPLTLLQAVVAATLFNLAFVLPSPPAQVGTAEVLPVLVFAYGFGLQQDVVASSALLWHFLSAAVILALGGYSTYRLGARLVFGATER